MTKQDNTAVCTSGNPVPVGTGKTHHVSRGGLTWISVQLCFDGEPVEGLEIEFFEEDGSGQRGAAVETKVTTNVDGIASLGRSVSPGSYLCAIECQPDVSITTTADPEYPIPLTLPIGTANFDPYDDSSAQE